MRYQTQVRQVCHAFLLVASRTILNGSRLPVGTGFLLAIEMPELILALAGKYENVRVVVT